MKKLSAKILGRKNSKEQEFELIYAENYEKIYSFVASKVKQQEKVSELTLDAFLRLWKHLEKGNTPNEITAYLFKIAWNVVYDYFQAATKQRGKQVFLNAYPELVNSAPNPEEEVLNDELKVELDKAINQLSPQSGKIFRMVRGDGMKYSEVAKELNISVNSVDTQLSRAVKKLRKILKSYNEEKEFLITKTIENLSVIVLIDMFLIFF